MSLISSSVKMLFHGGMKVDLLTAAPPSLIAVKISLSESFFISVALVWSLGAVDKAAALIPPPLPFEPWH